MPAAGLAVGQDQPVAVGLDPRIVERDGLGVGRGRIEDQLDPEPFGVRDPCIVIAGREPHLGTQRRPGRPRLGPAMEAVPGQHPVRAGDGIIKAKPEPDRQRAARAGPAGEAQKPERGIAEARGQPLDGNGRRQRAHEVRRVAQEPVALGQAFADQRDLAVFQVAQPAVDHP